MHVKMDHSGGTENREGDGVDMEDGYGGAVQLKVLWCVDASRLAPPILSQFFSKLQVPLAPP